jgi:putative spermidine/putrescine transport system substrate-binding protein
MKKKGLFLIVALFVLMLAVTPSDAGKKKVDLIVNSYGGAWEQFMRDVIVPAFEKEHPEIEIKLDVGLAKTWLANLRASGVESPPYDVMMTNEIWANIERNEGFFVPLPQDKVPNLKDVYPHLRNPDDNGVLGVISPIGLAYRPDLLQKMGKTPPTSWKDLWDPAYSGTRGLYTITNSAGMMFVLLASQLWGESQYDLDAGMLDFSGSMEIALTRGEIAIGVLDRPAVTRLKKQGINIAFSYPKEGVYMFEQDFNVLKGSKVKDAAYAYVNWILSPESQILWTNKFYTVPANQTVAVPAVLKDEIHLTGERIKEILKWDWSWINARRDGVIERWNKEIVSK